MTFPARLAAAAASCGVIRPSADRYTHWSSLGSIVPGSRNTVAPSRRVLPYSGAAIRLPTPRCRKGILRREQPVVAGQAHLTAQRYRLAEPGSQSARRLGLDGGCEEDPGVCPGSRARDFQAGRNAQRAGSLE